MFSRGANAMQESIEVDNVKCGGCVTSIKTVLSKIPGVGAIAVDVDTGLVDIEGENLNRDNLVKTLAALGFPER
jgi:copper chaperone